MSISHRTTQRDNTVCIAADWAALDNFCERVQTLNFPSENPLYAADAGAKHTNSFAEQVSK